MSERYDNLPHYPPVYDRDIETIKNADPAVLASINAVLFSGHAGTECESNPGRYCYHAAHCKFSALLKGINRIRNAA